MIRRPLIILSALFICGCSSLVSDGSSSTAGNPCISGTATKNGKPLSHAKLYILDTGYIPQNGHVLHPVVTDVNGQFYAVAEHAGIMIITLVDSSGTYGTIIDTVLTNSNMRIDLQARPFGFVGGDNATALLAVPGTPFFATDSLPVPSGITPKLVSLDSSGNIIVVNGRNIAVDSGSLVTASNGFHWKTATGNTAYLTLDSLASVIATPDSMLIFSCASTIIRGSNAGGWATKSFPGTTIGSMFASGTNIWAASDSGLILSMASNAQIYNTTNSILTGNDITAIGSDNTGILCATSTGIFHTDGTKWYSIPLPSGIIGNITAITGLDSGTALIGTSIGETRLLQNGVWSSSTTLQEFSGYSKAIKYANPLNDSVFCVAIDTIAILWNYRRDAAEDHLQNALAFRGIVPDKIASGIWLLQKGYLTYRDPSGFLTAIDSTSLSILGGKSAIGSGRNPGEIVLGNADRVVFVCKE